MPGFVGQNFGGSYGFSCRGITGDTKVANECSDLQSALPSRFCYAEQIKVRLVAIAKSAAVKEGRKGFYLIYSRRRPGFTRALASGDAASVNPWADADGGITVSIPFPLPQRPLCDVCVRQSSQRFTEPQVFLDKNLR